MARSDYKDLRSYYISYKYLLIMNKKQQVEDFYAHYKQKISQHSHHIVKVQHKEVTYYTSYAIQPSKYAQAFNERCTVVLFQRGGSLLLGYCLQTKGFPFSPQVEPIMKDNISFDSIKGIKLCEKYIKVEGYTKVKKKNVQTQLYFEFLTKQLKQRWFFLIVYLWQCRNKSFEIDIDLIVDKKQLQNFWKYQADQKILKQQLTKNKPNHQNEPLRSLTYMDFMQQEAELQTLKNREKQYSQTIDKFQKRLKQSERKHKQQDESRQLIFQSNRQIQKIHQQLQDFKRQKNTEIQQLKKQHKEQIQRIQNTKLEMLNQNAKIYKDLKQKEEIMSNEIFHLKKLIQSKNNQSQQHQKIKQKIKKEQQASNNIRSNQLQKLQHQINELQIALKNKNYELQEKSSNLAKQKKELYQMFQSQKQDLVNNIEALQKQIKQQRTKNQSLTEKDINLLSQNNSLLQKVQKLNKQLSSYNQKDNQISQLKIQIVQHQRKQKEIQYSLNMFKQGAERLERQLYLQQEKYKTVAEQYNIFKQQSSSQKIRLMEQFDNIKEMNQLNVIRLKESEQQKQKLLQQLNQAKNQKQKHEGQNQKLKQQINRLLNQLKQLSVLMKQMELSVKRTIQQQLNKSKLLHIFQGNILQDKQPYKEFMMKQIESYTKKKILKTKKLYILEKEVKLDFHRYIDEIPQIAVIVETEAGFYLAGYSQSPVSNKVAANKGGLILSLNNSKSFVIYPGKRSVTYDSFFLIIGNSEIRLKNQEWKVFSNFGIANSFFNSNGYGVNELLGQGPAVRQVKIVTFEIHQIIYE